MDVNSKRLNDCNKVISFLTEYHAIKIKQVAQLLLKKSRSYGVV